MRIFAQLLGTIASFALLPLALAQDKFTSPLEVATQSTSDKPITAVPSTPAQDVDLVLKTYLNGVWRSRPAGASPELLWQAAPVTVSGLANTALVEVARADSPADPFRIFVLQILVRQNALRLRQLEFGGTTGLKNALAGLIAAPSHIPPIELAALSPALDMPLARKNSGYIGATERPFPTVRNGAIEMTASIEFGIDSIRIVETGIDADGKQVWGQKDDGSIEFVPVHPEPKLITASEDGLIAITTVAPKADAPKLEPGGEVVLHYTSWLTTGQLIETSRAPGREPARIHIPGNVLPGLNKGLAGIAKGERRKIIIPPDLGYGAEGRAAVPPNATLIFDVECLNVDNSSPAPPPAPKTMFNPHAPPPGAMPHPPASDANGPIGSPPTNGGPETPRGGGGH